MSVTEGFVEFLRKTPSQLHVVSECINKLTSAGFTRLSEKENWKDKVIPNGKYFFTRNQTSLFAFTIGKEYKPGNGFSIVAAHTDSPYLKLKPVSKQESDDYVMLGVETYGGGKFYTWADRDLGIAGRVIGEEDGKIVSRLFNIDKRICFIPSLAIHLSGEKERGGNTVEFNKETNLLPILKMKGKKDPKEKEKEKEKDEEEPIEMYKRHDKELVDLICERVHFKPEAILDMEMYLYDLNKAEVGGLHDEFVFSGKIDNLSMTYCGLNGFLQSLEDPVDYDDIVRVLALFDNEEIGSTSLAGAESNSLFCIISAISGYEHVNQALRKSFLLSYDVSHAYNPEYSDKYESNHKCGLNKGLVLSYSANQSVATSSPSAAVIRSICKKYTLPFQLSVKKQNMREGSTVGPHLSTNLGMMTADMGIPQLAMHSIREMCGGQDIDTGIKVAKAFYREWSYIEKNMKLGEEF